MRADIECDRCSSAETAFNSCRPLDALYEMVSQNAGGRNRAIRHFGITDDGALIAPYGVVDNLSHRVAFVFTESR